MQQGRYLVHHRHHKSRAFIGEAGSFVRKLSSGIQETQLGYPLSAWYFLGHRPIITAFYFGAAHSIACVTFATLVMVDRHRLLVMM